MLENVALKAGLGYGLKHALRRASQLSWNRSPFCRARIAHIQGILQSSYAFRYLECLHVHKRAVESRPNSVRKCSLKGKGARSLVLRTLPAGNSVIRALASKMPGKGPKRREDR